MRISDWSSDVCSSDLDRIDSTIAHGGESDRYSFTLDERTRLLFDSFTQTSGINWTLSGPDGTVVSSRRFDQSDGLGLGANPVLDLSAGNWTLTIDGAGDAASSEEQTSELTALMRIT